MLLDTQHVEIRKKIAKIAYSEWQVCEECGRVCEGVFESVCKFHQWVSQLMYMLLDTQHVEIRQKLAKIA